MQRYEDSEVLRLQSIVIMSILINKLAYIVHKCKELEQKKKSVFRLIIKCP